MSKQLTLDFFIKKPSQSAQSAPVNRNSPASTSFQQMKVDTNPLKSCVADPISPSPAKFSDSIPDAAPNSQVLIDASLVNPSLKRIRPGPPQRVISSQLEGDPNNPSPTNSTTTSPRCLRTPGTSPRGASFSSSAVNSPSPFASHKRSPSSARPNSALKDDSCDDIGELDQQKLVANTGFTRQYLSIRSKLDNDTVLYIRKGRFFELYEKDSIFGNVNLGLKLARHASAMSLCGVPDYMLDKYIKMTLGLGKRVALADEFPEMDRIEKVQKRQITAIHSPGSVSSALLLGDHYGILFVETVGGTNGEAAVVQFYDPLRRMLLTNPKECSTNDIISWVQKLFPAEIVVYSDVFELVSSQLSTYFIGPIYKYSELYVDIASRSLVWDIELDPLSACPDASPAFRYYLHYLLQTNKILKPIIQGSLDDYINSITVDNMYHLTKDSSQIVTVPGLTLSSLGILPLCAADSFVQFEAVDASVFEIYNTCVTRDGTQMLRTWLMNPLYDIETIKLRQSAAQLFAANANHKAVETLLGAMKLVGTSLYFLIMGCRASCHYSSSGTLESSTISSKLFLQLLVTILRTCTVAEALHALLNCNEHKVRTNEMLTSFSDFNPCWRSLENLSTKISNMFELDSVPVMLHKDFKLQANSRDPGLLIADALLSSIERRYIGYLNDLAKSHRITSKIRGYPLSTLGPATSNAKTYTISPFPDRHLVVGDSVIPLDRQPHFSRMGNIVQVSSTKLVGRFSVLTPLPNEKIAEMNADTRAAENQSKYNEQALCRLLGVDVTAATSTINVNEKMQLFVKALDDLDFKRLLEVEHFLIRRKNSILNALKLELLAFLFDNEEVYREISSIIAQIDVLCCFSKLSRVYPHVPWSYPSLQVPLNEDEHIIDISGAYHPISFKLGRKRLQTWTPLDCTIKEDKMVILTGCNMSGKSTAMRLVGITVLLAQVGAPLPCSGMILTPYSAILAKIGNEEDMRSTFQKETADCACLLSEAMKPNARSLFLLDEFGRGTDSSTGDALAEAVCRQLLSLNLRSMISTHSPVLSLKLKQESKVKLCHMDFELKVTSIHFKHTICEGLCARSFGSQVARLAGFSEDLIERCDRNAYEFISSSILSTLKAVDSLLVESIVGGN